MNNRNQLAHQHSRIAGRNPAKFFQGNCVGPLQAIAIKMFLYAGRDKQACWGKALMALASYNDNDRALAERIIAENYDTLIDIARAKRRRADLGDTLQTSDLLHECWLKLDGKRQWNSEEHFIRAAVLAMRHVIIDHLRRRKADKRGGGSKAETLDEERAFPEFSETPEQLLQIGQMMEKLEASNPRWMRIVDARYFAGMTEEEAAGALNISARTVRREWRSARDWIGEQLGVAT